MKNLTLYSDKNLEFAFVDKLLFYSENQSKLIQIFDLVTNSKRKSINFTEYFPEPLGEGCSIFIDECSPHQIMRASHNSKLEK